MLFWVSPISFQLFGFVLLHLKSYQGIESLGNRARKEHGYNYSYVCALFSHSLCLTLCDPMDGNPQDILSMGILQARILEWVAMSSSRGSSQPRNRTQVSCIAGGFFPIWETRDALNILLETFGISWISLEHMLVDTGYRFYFRNQVTLGACYSV